MSIKVPIEPKKSDISRMVNHRVFRLILKNKNFVGKKKVIASDLKLKMNI